LGESVLMSLLALFLMLALVELALPFFANIVGAHLQFSLADDAYMLLTLLVLMLGAGVLAGAYPAFFLSAPAPVEVLRGNAKTGRAGVRLRSVLVVAQFAIASGLIISTLAIAAQMRHMREQNLGFDKENLVVVPLRSNAVRAKAELIKTALRKERDVLGASVASQLPGFAFSSNSFGVEGRSQEEMHLLGQLHTDGDFIETMQVDLLAGRSFISGDEDRSCIVNEAPCGRWVCASRWVRR